MQPAMRSSQRKPRDPVTIPDVMNKTGGLHLTIGINQHTHACVPGMYLRRCHHGSTDDKKLPYRVFM